MGNLSDQAALGMLHLSGTATALPSIPEWFQVQSSLSQVFREYCKLSTAYEQNVLLIS